LGGAHDKEVYKGAPVNAERLKMLKEVEARTDGGAPDVKAILRAYLIPPFRKVSLFGAPGAKFMQLLGRMHSEIGEGISGVR
jgi:hypothetical protein